MYRIILLRGSAGGLRLSKNLVTVTLELPATFSCLQISQEVGALLKQKVPVAMLNTYRKVQSMWRCYRIAQVMTILVALWLLIATEH